MWIEHKPPHEGSKGEREVKNKFMPLFQDRKDILVIQNFENILRPGGEIESDLVFVLAGEDSMAFTIEIKAYKHIAEIKCNNGMILPQKKYPYRQAEKARQSFHDFLEEVGFPSIWCQEVVLFTEMSKEELEDKLKECPNLFYMTLYRDFLDFTPEQIIATLRDIANKNTKKKYEDPYVDPSKLNLIRECFEKEIKIDIPKLDKERLRKIEEIEENEATKNWIADLKRYRHLIIQGGPSTGKTFSALAIARRLSDVGLRVLFTCFNKVLATDVKRLLCFDPNYREKIITGDFCIANVDQLIWENCFFPSEILLEGEDNGEELELQEQFAKAVEHFVKKKKDQHGQFDVIVVDEGQDMREYAWDFLRALGKPNCLYVVVLSGSQAIYRHPIKPEELLKKLGIEGKLKRRFKRTVWRNTVYNYVFATVFSRSGLGIRDFESVFRRLLASSKSLRNTLEQLEVEYDSFLKDDKSSSLEFARKKGRFPKMFFFSGNLNDRTKIDFLKNEILKRVKILKKKGYVPSDLLIMVPGRGEYYNFVVQLLNDNKIEYIDYVLERERRKPYTPDEMRLVTFHSSRGIEGALTIVLGFEEVETFENSDIFNLSFTVLTRAIFETMLFSTYDSPIKPTCLENLERLNLYLKSVFNEED